MKIDLSRDRFINCYDIETINEFTKPIINNWFPLLLVTETHLRNKYRFLVGDAGR